MKPAEKGFSMIVEYLLENNADPNITDQVRLKPVRVSSLRIARMSELPCRARYGHGVMHMEQSLYEVQMYLGSLWVCSSRKLRLGHSQHLFGLQSSKQLTI